MKMRAKQMTLIVAIMGVFFATSYAFKPENPQDQRSERMKERYEYFKNNVKPKVDAERNKLEQTLSAEDKKEVTRIREAIIKQKLMENQLLFEARQGRIKGEEFNESLWLELNAQRIVIENLYDQAKLIANKYRPQIDEMVTGLRSELREEMLENRPRANDNNARPGRGERYGQGGKYGRGDGMHRGFGPNQGRGIGIGGGFGPGMGHPLDIAGFLLWDVNRL